VIFQDINQDLVLDFPHFMVDFPHFMVDFPLIGSPIETFRDLQIGSDLGGNPWRSSDVFVVAEVFAAWCFFATYPSEK